MLGNAKSECRPVVAIAVVVFGAEDKLFVRDITKHMGQHHWSKPLPRQCTFAALYFLIARL